MDREIYVAIHGHFYQPPRENPWLDTIERQPSAYPYHDWNERIAAECYTPNTVSRILDPSGKIDDIVNNYEYINFNIGPTLFDWIEKYAPETYRRIIRADFVSRERNNGHGNAIAQNYSHMILPLADDNDLETQIAWGIDRFVARFNRYPEGMWMAETAANARVMAALVRHGIRYTILSPYQAQAIRKIGGDGHWTDVSFGTIDPRQPYRFFIKDAAGKSDAGKYIDIFFYDHRLATGVAFEHLLTNAGKFADAIHKAADMKRGKQIVQFAIDGESFGHHEPFGDMCLAAFFKHEVPKYGFKIINHAHYLELSPPAVEVELKAGPGGEGTAWSCAHGTGRWQRDCGCSTGGPSWWKQTWRAPLKKAFDNLRANLDEVFYKEMGGIVKDPVAARNDYWELFADARAEVKERFFRKHLKDGVKEADRVKALKLLESQKNSMYMYTSCGWFFSEISGIEAVQNMRYAVRALELVEDYGAKPLLQTLLSDLAQAPSNIPEFRDGRTTFKRLVWPSIMTMDKIAAANVMSALLTDPGRAWQPHTHRVESISSVSLQDRYRSAFGLARVTSRVTLESRLYAYYVTQFTPRDVRCYIKRMTEQAEFDVLRQRVEMTSKASLPEVFQGKFVTWGDLLPEVSARIMSALVDKDLEGLRTRFMELFQQNRELFDALVMAGLELPYEIRGLVKYALSRLLLDEVLRRRGDWRSENFAQAKEYVDTARRFGVDFDATDANSLLTEDALAEGEAVRGDLAARHFQNVIAILEIGKELGLSIRRDLVENIVLEILEEKVVPWIKALSDPVRDRDDYNTILEILDYAERLNFSRRRYMAMLEEFSGKVAASA